MEKENARFRGVSNKYIAKYFTELLVISDISRGREMKSQYKVNRKILLSTLYINAIIILDLLDITDFIK